MKKKESENFWNTPDQKDFIERRMKLKYDDWQWEYILTDGNTAARIGRQSGKSEAEAARLGLFCLTYKPHRPGLHLLITGGVERQAYELYQKMRRWLEAVAPSALAGKPQEKMLKITSGLTVRALPCGRDGGGLRNYAAAKIAIDEAHYVEDAVYIAVEPMLLTTMGTMDLMSTTRGNKGEFREAFREGSGYKTFHYKTLDVIKARKICASWTEAQRDFAIELVEKKRNLWTKNRFKQEFEAEFLDSLQQFFPSSLINNLMTLDPKGPEKFGRYFEGQDVAGWGFDNGAFVTVELMRNNWIEQRDVLETDETSTSDTIKIMRERERKWKHKQWIMDSGAGGGGGAIFDLMINDRQFRNKIIGINNASKTVDYKKGKRKRIIKEDLYNNLKRMMEMGEILLLKDNRVRESLLSIQFEWTESGNFRIFGNDSHITEALIRAAWCVKSKQLNIMAFC